MVFAKSEVEGDPAIDDRPRLIFWRNSLLGGNGQPALRPYNVDLKSTLSIGDLHRQNVNTSGESLLGRIAKHRQGRKFAIRVHS